MAIPLDGQEFRDYSNPHKKRNAFWKLLSAFDKMVGETQNAPQEIIDLFSYYRETQAALEEEEQEMAAGIATEIQKASEIEGVVDVRISDGHRKEDLEVDDIQAFGYKKYSFTLSAKLKEYNKPQRFETVKMFKIRSLLKTLYNRIVKWSSKKIYSSLIILSTPKSIQSAIAKFVKEKIIPVSEICWCPKPAHNKYLKIRFSYRYNRDGLRITLINMVAMRDITMGNPVMSCLLETIFPVILEKN